MSNSNKVIIEQRQVVINELETFRGSRGDDQKLGSDHEIRYHSGGFIEVWTIRYGCCESTQRNTHHFFIDTFYERLRSQNQDPGRAFQSFQMKTQGSVSE